MNPRHTTFLGSTILLFGIFGLLCAVSVNSIGHIGFGTRPTHSPTKPFNYLRCPLLLRPDETGVVEVSIRNPTDHLLHYEVDMVLPFLPYSDRKTIVIGAYRKASVAFPIQIQPLGNHKLWLEARSSDDPEWVPSVGSVSYPRYHTSFGGGCDVQVVEYPISFRVLNGLFIGFSGLLFFLGLLIERKRPDNQIN